MKKNWIRKIIGGLSFTSALFIFQACYGAPQDYGHDLLIEGQVKSETSGLPIEGIEVSVVEGMQYEITDENGNFSFYVEALEDIKLRFKDVDESANNSYSTKDTVLTNTVEQAFLNISLKEE